MVVGVALHVVAVLGGDIEAVRYGVGLVGAIALAWGCAVYLTGKGYPGWLGLPGFLLSICWVCVCVVVPDRYLDDMM